MGNRAKPSKIAAAVRIALLSSSPWLAAHAATLPIPCGGGACVNIPGVGAVPFVTSGSASWALSGSKLTVNQTSSNATLNWASFNISKDGTVHFVQPSSSSVALNEIYDSNPTQIFGALSANGKIFLINQNGIIFGNGAQVNVGGLVASTLAIAPDAVENGLTHPSDTGQPAFQAVQDANGNLLSQQITVQQGATLQAADGGQIFLFAPNVTNLGTIQTPDGQTVLAAGTSVYLAASSDPNLRGVLVEVQGTGTVSNGLASNSNVSSPAQLVGQIIAQNGNISLAAVAVNQLGRLNATTSVNENGSIYLQARQGQIETESTPIDEPGAGGTLHLGQNSDTEVTLDTSDPTVTVDTIAQPPSTIMMSGDQIDMFQGSVARATGGVIDVYADANFGTSGLDGKLGTSNWDQGPALGANVHSSDGSRFYMAPGSVLDVSGASITLPVSSNVIPVKLEGTELADSPLLRSGPLLGETIYVDMRANGTNANGTWWGTPVANVSGEILGITRNVVERNLNGGTVNIQSQGDVILAPSSQIDVSGGYTQYTGGYLDTSELLTPWGQTIPVGSASPDMPYLGVVNSTTTTDTKWGVTSTYQTSASDYSPGYVQGNDAGTLSVAATAFILDGTVKATTVAGQYQTQPTTAYDSASWVQESTSTGTAYGMYRPFDEAPKGGTLQIGSPGVPVSGQINDLVVDTDVAISAGSVLDTLTNANGSAFDPVADPLPANFTSILQPSLLDTFQNISVYTNGKLVEPAGVALSLAPGGSFTAQAADIDIEGGINVPSGTIGLTAQPTFGQTVPNTDLTLGGAAYLTAKGEWVNDSSTLYPNGNPAPLYINGGAISLSASDPGFLVAADLILKPGSLIDVSGGAQLTSSGSLNPGNGGSIKIDASTASAILLSGVAPPPASELELGATLQGYAVYDGGSLSIGAAGVCIAQQDCSGHDPTVIWLTPEFFDSGGFSSYSVTAGQNGLSIASGMDLQLMQRNFELPSGYTKIPDAASLVGLATTTVLPLQTRQPVDLTLALYYPSNSSFNNGISSVPTLANISTLPSLLLPQGDVISTDPGGSLTLASDTRVDVEGTLQAPGGAISLAVGFPSGDTTRDAAYDPTQGIWLGPDAVLDASGAAEIFPNSIGKLMGSVLAGGTVSLAADTGYIELLPGSVIDVSGTSGLIDIGPVGGGLDLAQRIASAGGQIELTSSDGGVIGGTLLAGAGAAGSGANQPAGGSLYVTENTALNPSAGASVNAPGSDIQVSPTLTPAIVAPGSAVPDALEGLTLLPTSALAKAGFSIVSLTSMALDQTQTYADGEIEFSGGVSLAASDEVSLDAAAYSVDGGTTGSVNAPYVEFGNSSALPYVPNIASGTGVLKVSGGFIELYGTSLLDGVGTASFDSSGDLRLRGIQYDPGVPTVAGALYGEGTINLTAQQIYPTTLTQFVISADPQLDPATITQSSEPTAGSIIVRGSEGTDTGLLSAGGSLTLVAASITQDGVLRAPFGTIALDATSLTLGAGSLTSTSANGLTIPFGNTQGNTQGGAQNTYDWTYLLGGITTVYGTDGQAPPSQNVELNAADVSVQSNAVIDISGGGDLQASEWIQGPGGTQNLLNDCKNCYAIIPGLHTTVAPYDPAIAASTGTNLEATTNLQLGDAVYLSGGSGVPAGTYVLLPAAYALLPGAYLVTSFPGKAYQDMQPGQTFTAPDGGTIVSGYLTGVGLPSGSSRLNGFDVTPASIFLNEAQYALTTGNQFFSGQEALAATTAAANEAASAMRLPQDAGVLDIDAYDFLTLNGALRATTGESSARGGEVDISNQNIVVAANAGTVSTSGALVLTASSLDQFGAQTLLLGGTDKEGAITTDAQTITILNGASLSAPQLLLAAQQQISVQGGASVVAAGTAPSTAANYSLSDTGALLAVSAGPQITVTATGTVTQGDLDLAAASRLNAGTGSAYLYATAGINTGGSIALSGGSLAVQAPAITLGNGSGNSATAVLGANLVGVGSLANLLLVSPGAIAIANGAAASAGDITIDAPGMVSQLTAGQSASISASDTLDLLNSQGTSIASSGLQGGSVMLRASNVVLGSAQSPASSSQSSASGAAATTFSINGFNSVALDAQKTVTADSNVDFSTDNDLGITASSITTAAGISASVTATGTLAILAPSASSDPPAAALGGALDITASSIALGTKITLPSGNVTLESTGPGGITLDSGGSISVAGVDESFGTQTLATPGGTVALSAASGAIDLKSGSSIDVSAGSGGMAGSFIISAPTTSVTTQGTLRGTGATQGGSFSIDAGDFGFAAVSAAVNAGGFTGSQSYRLRGTSDGDPGSADDDIAVTSTIIAQNVLLEADSGDIAVNGTINASGSSGGSVTLSAANGIILDGAGVIEAQATSQGGNGGTVEFDLGNNPSALLTLSQSSQINVSGGGVSTSEVGPGATAYLPGTGGTVLLRVPQSAISGVTFDQGAIVKGASSEILEAYEQVPDPAETDPNGNLTITNADGEFTSWQQTVLPGILTAAVPVISQQNSSSGLNFTVEPGLELDAAGNIELDTPWDLSEWRFPEGSSGTTVPGILTLRAGGSVTFNASLSDGFNSPTAAKLPTQPGSSWSYRIVAGADLNAADPLAVGGNSTDDVTIGSATSGALVRTGTGFIDVAASGSFVLSSLGSVLYTAGTYDNLDPAAPAPACGGSACGGPALPFYALGGGNISIDVAGDIQGAEGTDQFVNDWLWRQGADADGDVAPTAWAVQFGQFDKGAGVGTLGGGDLTIRAGGDIQNLSASVASIGVASGGGVEVKDGGNLNVSAGGSILGGLYYVGLGNATLSAGDTVGIGTGQAAPVSPLIALGEASVSVTARGDVQVSGIVNPTLLGSGSSDQPGGNGSGSEDFFSTYGSTSSATLTSVGGNTNLDDQDGGITMQYGGTLAVGFGSQNAAIGTGPVALSVFSPDLTLVSLSGNVNVNRGVIVFPSSQANLTVLAAEDITLNGGMVIPDVDPAALPSIADPQNEGQTSSSLLDMWNPFIQGTATSPSGIAAEHGSTPLFASVTAFDENPATFVASNGNVDLLGSSSGIWSGKPVIVSAGQDIIDLTLVAQNITPGDVTSITAGGDIVDLETRQAATGDLNSLPYSITVAGPGQLQVTAGNDVTLGTATGILTIGNQQNTALPSSGASISVEAGVGGSSATTAQYSAFINQYIDGSSQFDGQLVTYVEQITGQNGLTDAEAKQEFNSMAAEQQRTFLEQLFFDLLRTYGTEAATTGNNADFAGAYTAIQTLFPGANPDLSKGQTDPYSGSISLYFSQIYTEDGGSISLLAPGGEVNAGLALVPSSYGVTKFPDQLGVVAEGLGDVNSFSYGDFQVNQSRVFAADGGNILVWSTEGDIDAGRGSKTSLSASAPNINYDANGFTSITYFAPTSGSGIQALADTPGATLGNVALFAPHGVVNANEAGIVAGNLTIAATAVLGTNNITVTGSEVGVPVAVTGTGASVVGASSSAGGALSSAQTNLGQQAGPQQEAPKAAAELRWLDVFVLGFGEQTCSANDIECLKRQKHTAH